jgi:hypothetical protein
MASPGRFSPPHKIAAKGESLMDTIEMLAAIGSDASLRHAHAHELSKALQEAHASPTLTSAVITGDSSELLAEMGYKFMRVPQASQLFFGPAA